MEIGIPALMAHLKPEWSESDLRSLLSQISPVGQRAVIEHPQMLYIDLELLDNEKNMSTFRDSISRICAAIFGAGEPLPQ